MAFRIKKGDLLPSLQVTITDDDGLPLDLTGATVSLVLYGFVDDGEGCLKPSTSPFLTKPAAVVNPAVNGVVRYDWEPSDTASEGRYAAEFRAVIGGKPWTAPTKGYIPVTIGNLNF